MDDPSVSTHSVSIWIQAAKDGNQDAAQKIFIDILSN